MAKRQAVTTTRAFALHQQSAPTHRLRVMFNQPIPGRIRIVQAIRSFGRIQFNQDSQLTVDPAVFCFYSEQDAAKFAEAVKALAPTSSSEVQQ